MGKLNNFIRGGFGTPETGKLVVCHSVAAYSKLQ